MQFILTALRNPRWFLDLVRLGVELYRGEHNHESFENGLKIAARKYNVDYHRFD